MKKILSVLLILIFSVKVFAVESIGDPQAGRDSNFILELQKNTGLESLRQIDKFKFEQYLTSFHYSNNEDKIVRKYFKNSTKEQAKIYWADYIDKNIKPSYTVNYLGASKSMQENMKFTTENTIYMKYTLENDAAISTIIITYSFTAKEFSISLDKIDYLDKKTKKNILITKNHTSAELRNYYDLIRNDFLVKHAECIATHKI